MSCETPQAASPDGCASPGPGERLSGVLVDGTLRDWAPPSDARPGESGQFRAELGLPTEGAVVMTGHQASFWHAGILAKYLALDAICGKHAGVAGAWCVPDHVSDQPGMVAYPARTGADEKHAGQWSRRQADLFGTQNTPDLPEQLARAGEILRASDGERDTDKQISAHAALLDERLGIAPDAPVLLASRMHRTTILGELIASMRADPNRCTRLYNNAAAAHPEAGVRPLALDEDNPERTELPLWSVSQNGTLTGVRAGDLGETARERIRPKALLFTGLLRAHGCDLFVHGTGGGNYDLVTEDWLDAWLGWTLAPAGVATATLTLGLGVPDVTRADLRHAVWLAHHARHTPLSLGETTRLLEADRRKRALVEQIAASPRAERAALFGEMHALLERVREDHAPALGGLVSQRDAVASALADRGIARERSWPWLLHTDADLRTLRAAIDDAIGAPP